MLQAFRDTFNEHPLRTGLSVIFASMIWSQAGCWVTFFPVEYSQLVWQFAQAIPLGLLFWALPHKRPELNWSEHFQATTLIAFAGVAWMLTLLFQQYTSVHPTRLPTVVEMAQAPSKISYLLELVLGAAVFEEILFRGLLLRGAVVSGCSISTALALQALIFAISHGDFALVPFYVLTGLLLGWMSLGRGGLPAAMLFHAALNFRCAYPGL